TITDGLAPIGGGILLEGSAALDLSNCTLSDNEAHGTNIPGSQSNGGRGGGIEDTSTGTLTVSNSAFIVNTAIGVGPNNLPFEGSVLSLGGGIDVAFTLPGVPATGSSAISNSTFIGNQALGGSRGASTGGGAISNSSNTATMTVSNCSIID